MIAQQTYWSMHELTEISAKLNSDRQVKYTLAQVELMLGNPTRDRIGHLFELTSLVKSWRRAP